MPFPSFWSAGSSAPDPSIERGGSLYRMGTRNIVPESAV
jgi:hypothetical protein